MFDTDFFVETYGTKKKICARQWKTFERKELLDRLNASVKPRPLVYNLETTSHCNMRCIMCQRTTDMTRKKQHMDDTTFKAALEQIEPLPQVAFDRWQKFVDANLRTSREPSENNFYFDIITKSLTLHGFGEPLIDPSITSRVADLSSKNIPTYFSANPCNIKLEVMEELFDAGLGALKFAMDSLDDARAKEIRGGPADFTKSYELVRETIALKERKKAKTKIVMTMLDFEGDRGPGSEPQRFLELFKDDDVFAYVKTLDNRWLLKKKGKEEITRAEEKNHYADQYCEYPWTTLTILADGSVVPCMQDINGTWTLGNVNTDSLTDIWNGEKLAELRRLHVLGGYDDDFMCHAKCDWNIADYFIEK